MVPSPSASLQVTYILKTTGWLNKVEFIQCVQIMDTTLTVMCSEGAAGKAELPYWSALESGTTAVITEMLTTHRP